MIDELMNVYAIEWKKKKMCSSLFVSRKDIIPYSVY